MKQLFVLLALLLTGAFSVAGQTSATPFTDTWAIGPTLPCDSIVLRTVTVYPGEYSFLATGTIVDNFQQTANAEELIAKEVQRTIKQFLGYCVIVDASYSYTYDSGLNRSWEQYDGCAHFTSAPVRPSDGLPLVAIRVLFDGYLNGVLTQQRWLRLVPAEECAQANYEYVAQCQTFNPQGN